MRAQLEKYAERIDAMSLRERVMIFVAVVVVLVSIIMNGLIDPLQARQKRLTTQIDEQQKSTLALQAQIQALAQPRAASSEAANREKLAQTKQQLAAIESMLTDLQRKFVRPQRVAAVVEGVLLKNRQLTLVEMRNLPPTVLGGAVPKAGQAGIYRHGIEITVRGSYAALTDYLAMLEKLPDQLCWGGAQMNADGRGSTTLRLTVYTLSLDKSWLTI